MSLFGNIGAILQALGGALVAQLPDGTTNGGAARGAGAVDFQTARTSSAQVASGDRSVIGGGEQNTASGSRALVAGGQGNTASAAQSAIGGGINNTASGAQSVVAGGIFNSAAGSSAWIPGGDRAATRAQQMGAWAFGFFSSGGDAQAGERVVRRITTDATPLRLSSNGLDPASATNPNLPANSTYRLHMLVVAQQTGGSAGTVGDCASWEVIATIKRGAAASSTVVVGGRAITGVLGAFTPGTAFGPDTGQSDAAAAGWRLTVDADTTLGGLAISGTGELNKTIRWVARIISAEVVA